ncbi:MAG: hypothetical protein ABIE14_02365, partial [Patescibacteria group bacterium]
PLKPIFSGACKSDATRLAAPALRFGLTRRVFKGKHTSEFKVWGVTYVFQFLQLVRSRSENFQIPISNFQISTKFQVQNKKIRILNLNLSFGIYLGFDFWSLGFYFFVA